MFNCCRIPGEDVDWVERSNPSADEDHILVVRRNIFFTIRIKHAGKRLNAAELRLQISRVRATAYSLHVDYPGVGILTTEERRTWYEARNRLMRSDPEINGTALRAIQSAAFLIALDDARPQTREARAHQAWHGGSACHSNRWHDRPMNFSVCDNGFVGWSGEHSTMDGSVSHRLHDTINQWMFQEKLDFDVRDEFIRIADLPAPEQIFFHLDESNLRDITTATTKHIARFSNQEVHCEEFREYGKDEIKRIFQCSPTAFLQLAMQVAYNRISGSTRATYAGVGANQYRDGRTETVRIVSPESIIFCQTMANPIASRCEKLDALNSALAVVVQRYHDSLDGRGFDRHLWALEKLTRAHCDSTGAIVPSMFRDPAYTRSQTWHLSTTQRASAWYDGGGFAQVEDDGIGYVQTVADSIRLDHLTVDSVAFHVFQHRIQFNIASLGPACVTMGKAIREAAIELRDLGLNRTASKGYDTANL